MEPDLIVTPGRLGCYLAGFRGTFPEVPAQEEVIGPAVEGAVDCLGKNNQELAKFLYNDVKVCNKCGRPCAWSQKSCQACGTLLEEVPVTQTENVMMGFIFGVERTSKFPLRISIRRQTADAIVFDDLLSMSTCHLNALPTRSYLPDWRWLLREPREAKQLLTVLVDEAWQATLAYLHHEDWRKFAYKTGVTEEMVRENVICGFNSPPSQFQLHLQWIVLPLLPFHHEKLLARTHAQKGRWFPLEYVERVIEYLDSAGEHYNVQAETPLEDIISHFETKGVSYDEIWTRCFEKYCASYELLSNWNPADFSYVVYQGKVHEIKQIESDGRVVCGQIHELDTIRVQDQDKFKLQNYGRKYDIDNKPFGTYYKHHKACKIGDGGIRIWPGL